MTGYWNIYEYAHQCLKNLFILCLLILLHSLDEIDNAGAFCIDGN